MGKGQLIKKLSTIMGKVTHVEKKGTNKFHGYDYAQEADFLAAVRTHLSEAGIFILTSFNKVLADEWIETKNGKAKLITLEYEHEIIDSESGESVVVQSIGTGIDTQDKGTYKAITGAMKYFISKNFLIPTGDDPENDYNDHEPAKKASEGSSNVSKVADAAQSAKTSKQAIEKVKPEKKEEPKKKTANKPHSETYGKFLDQMRTEKKRFIESKGEKDGTELYYQVLSEFNVKHSNEVPSEDLLTMSAIFFQMKALVADQMYPEAAAKAEEYIQKIIARDRELGVKG